MRGCCKTQILVLRLAFAGAFSSQQKATGYRAPSATLLLLLWDPAGTFPMGEVYSKTNSGPVNNFNSKQMEN
jgi:hypothetical protein